MQAADWRPRGYNVYPIEVESVLAEHPRGRPGGGRGHPCPVVGEISVAFVIPPESERASDAR